ncbi:MAG TPA: hypothetical protein VMF89_05570 [Polyangiales bacterium]|nr:hypothetical protein [Polyangiales bacterium]
MFNLIVTGGWIMGFLLILGGFALFTAFDFTRRPQLDKLPRLEALSRAIAWAITTGVGADLAAVGTKIPAKPEWAHSPDLHLLLLTGVAESMSPIILGGALLSVIALLTAAGHARLRNGA